MSDIKRNVETFIGTSNEAYAVGVSAFFMTSFGYINTALAMV
jgi:hypothetical protein